MKTKETFATALYDSVTSPEAKAFIVGFETAIQYIRVKYAFMMKVDEPGLLYHEITNIDEEEFNE